MPILYRNIMSGARGDLVEIKGFDKWKYTRFQDIRETRNHTFSRQVMARRRLAAETHELVDVILFMCSDNASFVTGTNHVIDGGRLCMYRPYVAP